MVRQLTDQFRFQFWFQFRVRRGIVEVVRPDGVNVSAVIAEAVVRGRSLSGRGRRRLKEGGRERGKEERRKGGRGE